MADRPLAGARAVVTGAGGPIGRAIAVLLADEGATVGALDRDAATTRETVAAIRDAGGSAVGLVADITDEASIATARDRFVTDVGDPTILVNNAGVAHAKPLADLDAAEWRRIVDVNLTGTLIVTQAFTVGMRRRRSGRIVNMASMSAVLANANQHAYGAAKGGVISLTGSLALDLGPLGITVNAVCPGAVDTPAARRILTPEAIAGREARIPLGRLAAPEDVAAAVAFLVSPGAAYISGVTLYVDGGLHIAGVA